MIASFSSAIGDRQPSLEGDLERALQNERDDNRQHEEDHDPVRFPPQDTDGRVGIGHRDRLDRGTCR